MPTEFWIAVIVAAITAGGSIICQLLVNKTNRDVILYRIGELEKKQDKYNNLQERTYQNEKDIAVLKSRVEDLEDK